MSGDKEQYLRATAEERERIREQRCIKYFTEHGVVPCVCIHCGATIANRYNFEKHVRHNSKCHQLRRLSG